MSELYDPLTWGNLMAGLIVRFEQQPRVSFAEVGNAEGPGIYALFYTGQHPAYAAITGTPLPIYVGKAVPRGTRKGSMEGQGQHALRDRLSNHRRSIDAAGNLQLEDFLCRFLAVVPVWVTLTERFLIDHYRPIWTTEVDGFGNNPQGIHRTTGDRSWWDTLHPGRDWAAKRTPKGTEADALSTVAQFFRKGDDA